MKNIDVWRQRKFMGGENSNTPPSQLEPEQVQEVLNMFPNVYGSELVLRTGFVENAFSSGTELSDFAKCISMLGTTDQSSIFRLDGILHANYVANGGNTDLKLWVSYPDQSGTVDIPIYANVSNEQIWTSGGTAPAQQGAQQPDIETTPSGVVRWIDAAPNQQCQSKEYEPAASAAFAGVPDFWVNDAGDFADGSSIPTGYNESTWLDEAAVTVEDSMATGYLTSWHNSVTGANKIPADIWYNSSATTVSLLNLTNDLAASVPFYFKPEAIIGDSTHTNPTLTFPNVKFSVALPEPNTPLHILFSYNGTYVGGMAQVYVRDASIANSAFTLLSQKSGTPVPVKMVDQSTLSAGQRWSGTGALASYIDCSGTLAYTNVQVKIVFMPDNNVPASAYHEQLASGGLFVGYYYGAA